MVRGSISVHLLTCSPLLTTQIFSLVFFGGFDFWFIVWQRGQRSAHHDAARDLHRLLSVHADQLARHDEVGPRVRLAAGHCAFYDCALLDPAHEALGTVLYFCQHCDAYHRNDCDRLCC